jgi:hypothetical protein
MRPRSVATILLPAIATLVVAVAFGQGLRGSDDLDYAEAAMALLRGEGAASLLPAHHHEARLGMVLPLACVFSAFGASDLSLVLLPLVCTALTASLVSWLACRSWGGRAGLAAGLLYALVPLPIQLATTYVPEPILTFELCLAAVLFLAASEDRPWRPLHGLLAGAVVGAAYLTTEVGALMLAVFCLHRLLGGGLRARDAGLLAGFLLVFALELTFHAVVHGDPLYRFALLGRYPVDPLGQAANEDLVYRLLAAYPSAFAYPGTDFGLAGPLLAAAGLYGCVRFRESGLYVLWAASLLLFYDLMTSSFTHYVALPFSTRLVAPACAPLAVLSGKLLVDLWSGTGRLSVGARRAARGIALAGGAAVVAASLLSMALNLRPTLTLAATRNARAVARFFRDEPAITWVCDLLSARALRFYRDFRPDDAWRGFAAASRSPRAERAPPAVAVLNGPILHESELTGGEWGGVISLPPADRDAVVLFEPAAHAAVFRAAPESGRWLGRLLDSRAARALLDPWSARSAKALTSRAPLVAVRAFRLGSAGPPAAAGPVGPLPLNVR